MASQAEAQAGTASNRYMTPQRTAQAISSLATSNLVNRLNDNQFNSTANLSSYPLGISTMLVNTAGAGWPAQSSVVTTFNTNNTRFGYQEVVSVTDNRRWYRRLTADNTWGDWFEIATVNMINDAYTVIANHTNSVNNPHNVTAGQTGAYTRSEVDGRLSTTASQLTSDLTPQTGTNNNGAWIRFPDGTLICTMNISVDLNSGNWQIFSFPHVFQFIPGVPTTPQFSTDSAVRSAINATTIYSSSTGDFRVLVSRDRIVGTHTFRVTAIGRWMPW